MPPVNVAPSASTALGYLLLFSGMALVGVYTALSKPLSGVFPVFLLAWLRFAIAAVVMIPWLRAEPDAQPPPGSVWRTLFVQSFFGNFLFSILMLTGVALTSAAAAGVVMAALPPLVAVMSWLWLRERAGWRVWSASALAAAGIALLSSPSAGPDPSSADSLGNLLILGAAACEAIYVILGKHLTASLSPRRISAVLNLIGLALMTPLGLWQALRFDFGQIAAPIWALLVFYSLSASMISTWLWLSGLQRVPASHSGVFTVALPLAATTVAATALGESLGLSHLAALGCAVTGIALVAWPAGDSPRPSRRV